MKNEKKKKKNRRKYLVYDNFYYIFEIFAPDLASMVATAKYNSFYKSIIKAKK